MFSLHASVGSLMAGLMLLRTVLPHLKRVFWAAWALLPVLTAVWVQPASVATACLGGMEINMCTWAYAMRAC